MNMSLLFKQAHKLTKTIIRVGDSYMHTFGLCLKLVKQRLLEGKHVQAVATNARRASDSSQYELMFCWLSLSLVCLFQGAKLGFGALQMLMDGLQVGLVQGAVAVFALIVAQGAFSQALHAMTLSDCVERR